MGDDLREWRTLRKHTYRRLAERVHCEHSVLWKIEHGTASLTFEMAQKCDEVLKTDGALVAAWKAHHEQKADTFLRPAQLPPTGARLVGRGAELEALNHAAFHRSSRAGGRPVVIAMDGPAGGGKTALALQWAHEVSPRYEDGQLYADLGGFGEPEDAVSVDDVLDSFLSALGSRCIPTRSDKRVAHYRSVVAGRRLLIVLDNVPDTETVERLLPGTDGCCVIVTSRQTLTSLVARVGATRVTAGPLSDSDAFTIMRRGIGPRADAEPGALASVAEMCGRLPLALRAAAEQIAIDSHRSISDFVDDFRTGGTSWLDVSDLVDLRRTIAWSYQRLPDDAAQVLRLAALLGREAVHLGAIAAVTGTSRARTRRVIFKAAAVHLADLGPDDMVRIQPLVRDYLREHADRTIGRSQRVVATQRLVAWYVATARSASLHLAKRNVAAMETLPVVDGVEPLVFVDAVAARTWAEAEAENFGPVTTLALEYGPGGSAHLLVQVLADIGVPEVALVESLDDPVDDEHVEADVGDDVPVGAQVPPWFRQLQEQHSWLPSYRPDVEQPGAEQAFMRQLQTAALTFLSDPRTFGRRATDHLWADVCGSAGVVSAFPTPASDAEGACITGERPDGLNRTN
ncbi:MAG: NB-ARC domain-containing protein [Actinophytocola sp.]|uniref:NB-ARC domain-containing protein n=1 Tax=Actinophytocola sp. TaxID=1872138 RepID=UPI003C730AF5